MVFEKLVQRDIVKLGHVNMPHAFTQTMCDNTLPYTYDYSNCDLIRQMFYGKAFYLLVSTFNRLVNKL